jgi:hypothetical protein
MKLAEYLLTFDPPMRAVDFASKCGIAHGTVYSWLNGQRKPIPMMRKLVMDKTEGKVTFKDW